MKSRLASLPPQSSRKDGEKATILDMSDMQKKLLRKGVLPSLSLAYKKPTASLLIGNHKLRTVRREEKKKPQL
jgi:hypothetical protein